VRPKPKRINPVIFTDLEKETISYAMNHYGDGKYPLVRPGILETLPLKDAIECFVIYIAINDFTESAKRRNSVIYENLKALEGYNEI